MLFEHRFWPGIADGTITVTFRRWPKLLATAGRTNRTAGAILHIESVELVTEADISDVDAVAAGYPNAAALIEDLRGDPATPLYRIHFRRHEGPDPREVLAHGTELTPAGFTELAARLDRLDRASAIGPWTEATLRLIAAHPTRRAGDLCLMVGREMAPFKIDVRKLKNLGLTISLEVGYRVSPRGRAYLDRLDEAAGEEPS